MQNPRSIHTGIPNRPDIINRSGGYPVVVELSTTGSVVGITVGDIARAINLALPHQETDLTDIANMGGMYFDPSLFPMDDYDSYSDERKKAVPYLIQVLSSIGKGSTPTLEYAKSPSGQTSIFNYVFPMEDQAYFLDESKALIRQNSGDPVRGDITKEANITPETDPEDTILISINVPSDAAIKYAVFGLYSLTNEFMAEYSEYSNFVWGLLHGGSGSTGTGGRGLMEGMTDPSNTTNDHPYGDETNSYSTYYDLVPAKVGDKEIIEFNGYGGNALPFMYLANGDPYVDSRPMIASILGIIPFDIYQQDNSSIVRKVAGDNRWVLAPNTEFDGFYSHHYATVHIPLITQSTVNGGNPALRDLNTPSDWGGASSQIKSFADPELAPPPTTYAYYLEQTFGSVSDSGKPYSGYPALGSLKVMHLARHTFGTAPSGLVWQDPIIPICVRNANPNAIPQIDVYIAGRRAIRASRMSKIKVGQSTLSRDIHRNSEPWFNPDGSPISAPSQEMIEYEIKNKRSLPDGTIYPAPVNGAPPAAAQYTYGNGDYILRRMLFWLQPSTPDASYTATIGTKPVLIDGLVVLWINRDQPLSNVSYDIVTFM